MIMLVNNDLPAYQDKRINFLASENYLKMPLPRSSKLTQRRGTDKIEVSDQRKVYVTGQGSQKRQKAP